MGYHGMNNLSRHTELLDEALDNPMERYVRAIAEEAGEVVGAFNKMTDGRTDKPKSREDVIHEMAQLIACCFLLSNKLGFDPFRLLLRADKFLVDKAHKINGEEYYTQ